MTDSHLPPTKPFPSLRWLISGTITLSLICGGIGAVGVLFFADGIFHVGKDPALSQEQVQRFESRMTALEHRAPETAAPDPALQNSLAELQQKVDAMSAQANQSKMGQVVLALTQIKDAYDHDQSMRPGLELLQKTVTNKDVLTSVDHLSQLLNDSFPTKAGLVAEAQTLLATPPRAANLSQESGGLLGQAKAFLGQFVQVELLQGGASYDNGPRLVQALSQDDLPTARSLASQLPVSPAVQHLLSAIEMRIRAQGLVQNLISSVTQIVGSNGEGLY